MSREQNVKPAMADVQQQEKQFLEAAGRVIDITPVPESQPAQMPADAGKAKAPVKVNIFDDLFSNG